MILSFFGVLIELTQTLCDIHSYLPKARWSASILWPQGGSWASRQALPLEEGHVGWRMTDTADFDAFKKPKPCQLWDSGRIVVVVGKRRSRWNKLTECLTFFPRICTKSLVRARMGQVAPCARSGNAQTKHEGRLHWTSSFLHFFWDSFGSSTHGFFRNLSDICAGKSSQRTAGAVRSWMWPLALHAWEVRAFAQPATSLLGGSAGAEYQNKSTWNKSQIHFKSSLSYESPLIFFYL